jgi:uncharacterized membrane protein
MAGIGFVLQKVLKEGGIGSFFKVAIVGTIIVAGPWLLSIIGIFVIGQLSNSAIEESKGLFMAVIIYSYAFSLIIFGGFHYIFTRHVADLVYEKKKREAGSVLLIYSGALAIASFIVSYFFTQALDLRYIKIQPMFRISGIILFVSINLIWLLMIFISLLKRYILIFIIYLIGMALSVVGVVVLGKLYFSGGALLGFSLGQAITAMLLYLISFMEFLPGKIKLRSIITYFMKFRFLFLTGIFYYWGMWVDKVVFWFMKGTQLGNTYFHVFDLYDIPVYLANLTMIPGLIYFVVVSETDFYSRLTEFLKTLHSSIYKNIRIRKDKIVKSIGNGLKEQSLFQGIFTIVLMLIASDISRILTNGAINTTIFRITLAAVFFHLIFLTIVVFLFYLQAYKQAFISAFCFFIINLTGSISISIFNVTYLCGTSYLAAAVFVSVLSGCFLYINAKKFDRLVYYSAAQGE